MPSTRKLLAGIVSTGLALATASALADRDREFTAKLQGVQEVPSVVTKASGRFKLEIDRRFGAIEWELRYQDLEGMATQAHIHIGQQHTTGGISVWLCANTPPITPPPQVVVDPCPTTSGRVSGTLTAANVVGPSGQGVSPGELEDLLEAIRRGAAYVNVHSTMVGSGEIRGQIKDDD